MVIVQMLAMHEVLTGMHLNTAPSFEDIDDSSKYTDLICTVGPPQITKRLIFQLASTGHAVREYFELMVMCSPQWPQRGNRLYANTRLYHHDRNSKALVPSIGTPHSIAGSLVFILEYRRKSALNANNCQSLSKVCKPWLDWTVTSDISCHPDRLLHLLM